MLNENAYALGSNPSVIRDLAAYGAARAAVVGKENVYDYSIGNPSLPVPQAITDAVRDILQEMDSLEIHSYTADVGDRGARQAIADDLNDRFGTDIGPDELFLGCGTSPELCAVFRAVTFPGARILAIAPYFPEYKPFVETAGAEFCVVPPQAPDFQIPMEDLEAMVTPNTAAVIVNSPNNPAGTVYTEQTLRQLGALLEAKSREYGHPIYIVSDEPYRELVYDGTQVPFLPGIYRDTVICYSYSKSLSLPGERIGYVYVPRQATDGRKLHAAVAGAARANGHICAPSLWQKVIARCASLKPDMTLYDRNRRTLYEALTQMGYEVAKPAGAFYLFVKAPGMTGQELSDRAKQQDILLVPGDSFGCSDYVRICYCVDHDMILRSLPAFRALLQA